MHMVLTLHAHSASTVHARSTITVHAHIASTVHARSTITVHDVSANTVTQIVLARCTHIVLTLCNT